MKNQLRLFSYVPVMNPYPFKVNLNFQTLYHFFSPTVKLAAFLHKTPFGFCLPNHCLSFTVLPHLIFQFPSLSRSKSNLVYCLHPLEQWVVLDVLFAVISIGRKEGKFQERKRTVMYFLLSPLFLSHIFLSKGRTSAGS